jgi:hypothetical protein
MANERRQVSIFINGREVENTIKSITAEKAKMNRELNRMIVGSTEYEKQIKDIGRLDNILKDHRQKLGGIETGWKSVTQGATKFLNASSIATAAGLAGISIGAEAAISAIVDTVEQTKALRREISQATGAVGDELDTITIKSRAIARTFQQTESEVVQSANALAKEFGVSYSEALGLISEGFIQGANSSGQFLENVREYSTQFRAAGFAASEFINLNIKAANEGIFNDKGLDTVKEFGLRIREQTKAVGDALDGAFGKQFTDKIFKGINDGSISTQKALQLVVQQINATEIPASKLQTVIADVFAAPGEDAGLRFIETLADVGDGIDETITRTNQYVEAQRELLEANENLATSENDLTKQLTETSDALTVFWTNLKAGAINVLVDVLQFFEEFGATLGGVRAAFGQVIDSLLGRETEFKSVGEAYRKSYLEGLKEIEVKRKTAEAFRLDEEQKKELEKQADERRKIAVKAAEKTRQEQQREAERELKDQQKKGEQLLEAIAKFKEEERLLTLSENDRRLAEVAAKYQDEIDQAIELEKSKNKKVAAAATMQKTELLKLQTEALKAEQAKIDEENAKAQQEKNDAEMAALVEHLTAMTEAEMMAEEMGRSIQKDLETDLRDAAIELRDAQTTEEVAAAQDKFNQILDAAKAYGVDVQKIFDEVAASQTDTTKKLTEDQKKRLENVQEVIASLQKVQSVVGDINEAVIAAGLENTKFGKALAAAQIAISGAVAVAKGVESAIGVPFPANLVAIATVVGAVVTTIASAKKALEGATVPQRKHGGFADVRGADDGQLYHAKLIGQPSTGMLDYPHPVLTSSGILSNEVGKEYYVSHSDLRKPAVLDHVRAIENITSHRQRAGGGFASTSPTQNVAAPAATTDPALMQLLQMNAQFLQMLLAKGVQANIGNDEILAMKRQIAQLDKASGGRL